MNRFVVLLGLSLILSACDEAAAPVAPKESFRRDGAPIASVALFDAERFLGKWDVVAEYPGSEPDCGSTVTWAAVGPGYSRARCPGAADAKALSGPGRFTGSGDAPIWVLWVDVGYRTAVIGTPDGSFGRILNRGGPIPSDRLRAAKELLDFNGYDTERLLEVPS